MKIKQHHLFIKYKKYFRFLFFCVVGITAFLIDWAIFNLFYKLTEFFILSLIFGWCISMIFNFSVNRNITFSARGYLIKKQLSKWIIIYLIAFLTRIIIGRLVLFILGGGVLNANIAYFAGVLISIPIAFFGSLLWVFKKRN